MITFWFQWLHWGSIRLLVCLCVQYICLYNTMNTTLVYGNISVLLAGLPITHNWHCAMGMTLCPYIIRKHLQREVNAITWWQWKTVYTSYCYDIFLASRFLYTCVVIDTDVWIKHDMAVTVANCTIQYIYAGISVEKFEYFFQLIEAEWRIYASVN